MKINREDIEKNKFIIYNYYEILEIKKKNKMKMNKKDIFFLDFYSEISNKIVVKRFIKLSSNEIIKGESCFKKVVYKFINEKNVIIRQVKKNKKFHKIESISVFYKYGFGKAFKHLKKCINNVTN